MKKNIAVFSLVFLLVFTSVAFAQGTGNLEDAIINVAKNAGPAVVSISTEHTQKMQGAKTFRFNTPFGQNDPSRKFFEDFFNQMPDREFKQNGQGTGVIINAEGYILTNEHVVGNADKITVLLPDGREFKGEVKGKDRRADLAVIKISAKNLPVAKLGDSDSLKIGQWVVAIGNPFGFIMQNPEPTVTVGVISALHRSLGRTLAAQDKDYNDLIQTDAAINPGNSGGPLVNLKGEIIGINVAIFSTSGGYQGLGFAIPSNNAKRIISRLIEGKKIAYGWLGVSVQNLNEDLVRYFGLADKNGVLIAKALDDSPALKAGIKDGDIIKQIDGKPINTVKELLSVVGGTEVGRKIKISLIRDKKPLTVEVKVAERPDSADEGEEGNEDSAVSETHWRGLSVQDSKKGVVITEVEPDSAADDAELIPGEVISEINKQPIKNIADYEKATKSAKGDCLVRTSRGYFVLKSGK